MADEMVKQKKGDNFRVYVGTSFPNNTFSEIEELARTHDFRNAEVVRALVFRGLEAYRKDGVLCEEKDASVIVPRRRTELKLRLTDISLNS